MRLAHARCAICECAACTHNRSGKKCGSCYSLGRPYQHAYVRSRTLFEDAATCPSCERNERYLLRTPPTPSSGGSSSSQAS